MSKYINSKMLSDVEAVIGSFSDHVFIDLTPLDANANVAARRKLRALNVSVVSCRAAMLRQGILRLKGVSADSINGAVALVSGADDVVALTRAVAETVKEFDRIALKGGFVEGKIVDAAAIESLSRSPNRSQLLSMIATAVDSVGSGLVASLDSVGQQLAGAIDSAGSN